MVHLDALRERLGEGDVDGAVHHLPFLQHDHGVDVSEYRSSKMKCFPMKLKSTLFLMLTRIPLPLHKYLETLTLKDNDKLHAKVPQCRKIGSSIRDLYHYARISGIHILECVVETALSTVRMEQLHVSSNVLSLFPFHQPLVAVLGWDLLSGKAAVRRTLMQLLWTSKSQVLRLEEYPLYGKQSNEMSCVEYLCDLLCFHLDVAYFVACVNSGHPWSSKDSLLFPHKGEVADERDTWISDPFVEKLMSLQPIASTSAAWKRRKT